MCRGGVCGHDELEPARDGGHSFVRSVAVCSHFAGSLGVQYVSAAVPVGLPDLHPAAISTVLGEYLYLRGMQQHGGGLMPPSES